MTSFVVFSTLLAVCSIVRGGPIHHQYGLVPNTGENIALIASGDHLQKIEELSGQFEGDIVLTELQSQAINGHLRNGLVNTTFRWENNVVPYNISDDMNDAQRAEVLKGLRAIEEAAPCLSFVQRTVEEDYIEVYVRQAFSFVIESDNNQMFYSPGRYHRMLVACRSNWRQTRSQPSAKWMHLPGDHCS